MEKRKKEPVVIEVTNARDGFLVVATRILNPKQTVKVPFSNIRQLEDAQIAEKNKAIEIHTEITPEIIEQLGGEPEETPEEPEGEEPEETPEEPEGGEPEGGEPEGEEPEEYTAGEIDKMTIKEMKELIEDKDIKIENVNDLKAAELKEAVKEALGLI